MAPSPSGHSCALELVFWDKICTWNLHPNIQMILFFGMFFLSCIFHVLLPYFLVISLNDVNSWPRLILRFNFVGFFFNKFFKDYNFIEELMVVLSLPMFLFMVHHVCLALSYLDPRIYYENLCVRADPPSSAPEYYKKCLHLFPYLSIAAAIRISGFSHRLRGVVATKWNYQLLYSVSSNGAICIWIVLVCVYILYSRYHSL